MRASIIMLLVLTASCGVDEASIKQEEDAKLAAAVQAEEAKVPETLDRIKAESQDRIHGRTPVQADTVAPVAATPLAATPAAAAPTTTQALYPHSIQVAAFATQADADRSAAEWKARGFQDVRVIGRDPQTTAYPFAVRLFGYDGYAATRTEADRINQRFGIGSFPVQERP